MVPNFAWPRGVLLGLAYRCRATCRHVSSPQPSTLHIVSSALCDNARVALRALATLSAPSLHASLQLWRIHSPHVSLHSLR